MRARALFFLAVGCTLMGVLAGLKWFAAAGCVYWLAGYLDRGDGL